VIRNSKIAACLLAAILSSPAWGDMVDFSPIAGSLAAPPVSIFPANETVSVESLPAVETSAQTLVEPAPAPVAVPALAPVANLPPLPEVDLGAQTPLATLDLTESPDDLLERIRKGFSMPELKTPLVQHYQEWYQNRPDYLRRMVERSRRYLHFIVEELEKRGFPTELALLPMVESSFDPMAHSRSRASGLWQFIPGTGKNYNLHQDSWVDERRDILASTSAALDYLDSIYRMHGDWFLALASYNCGEGAVARAIRKNENKGLPTDYASLPLPAETRHYVPRLQALKNILSNPEALASLNLPEVPNRPYFTTVAKPADGIDIKLAAQLAEIPVDEFVALNPAHKRPVIKTEAPLVLPADKAEVFAANLENHRSADKPLSSWSAYTLKPGERLEKVAARFRISAAELKKANSIGKRERVGPGYTLLVPAGKGAATGNLELAQDSAPARSVELPANPRADAGKRAGIPGNPGETIRFSHRVKPGETLFGIAQKYGISVAELKRQNSLKGNRLSVGAMLTVLSANVKPAPNPPGRPAPALAAAESTRYTIRRGDTLASIARRFNVGEDDLLRWNNVVPTRLQPGQRLNIARGQSEI